MAKLLRIVKVSEQLCLVCICNVFFCYAVEGGLQIFKNIGQMMEQTHSNIFM